MVILTETCEGGEQRRDARPWTLGARVNWCWRRCCGCGRGGAEGSVTDKEDYKWKTRNRQKALEIGIKRNAVPGVSQ